MKVYFFPGVGADEALGRYHQLPGHDVVWVRWPEREARDWPDFVDALDTENAIDQDSVFIGISFGGMAALSLAARKKPRGVILLSSCRSSRSVAPMLRLFKPLVRSLPLFLFNINLLPRPLAALYFGIRGAGHVELLYEMGRRLKPAQFRAINALALRFQSPPLPGLPILSLHGSKDRMILASAEPRDHIIQGGGHLISMTHTNEVDRVLMHWIEKIETTKRLKNP